ARLPALTPVFPSRERQVNEGSQFSGPLGSVHKPMVDVRDDLALLIAQGRTYHHEHHRAAAAGLVVNFLHCGAERDLIPGANRRDELEVLARVETPASEARHVLKEMAPVAKCGRKRRRGDDAAVGSFLRGLVVGEERIGLADRLAELRDPLARYRHRLGGLESFVDECGIEIYHDDQLASAGIACGTGLRLGRKSTAA